MQDSALLREGIERGRELDLAQLADVFADELIEQFEDNGRQHMHAEKAKVVPARRPGTWSRSSAKVGLGFSMISSMA